MKDLFLSYAKEDRDRVLPLVRALEEYGLSVWWDQQIPPGMTWPQVIERALTKTRGMVVVWTEASVRSKWVQIEATRGEERGDFVPILFDPVQPPLAFSLIQAADLVGWDGSPSDPGFLAVLGRFASGTNLVLITNVPRSQVHGRVRRMLLEKDAEGNYVVGDIECRELPNGNYSVKPYPGRTCRRSTTS